MRAYFRFLARVIDEDSPESRKGLVVVIAIHALTLVLGTLTVAGLFGMEYKDAFSATVWGIVTLASIVYGVGKWTERNKDESAD